MSSATVAATRETTSSALVRAWWNGSASAPDGWCGIDGVEPSELVESGLEVATGSVDYLYVGPAIGQIDTWNLPVALEELRRVLAVGGRIRVAAYDLTASVEAHRRGDAAFFWDQSSGLDAAFAAQLLDFGVARSLFTGEVLCDLLRSAGFAEVVAVDAGESADATSGWAALDRFGRRCCHVEAANPAPWPAAAEGDGPSAIHLAWGDREGRTMRVLWSGPAASEGTLAYRPVGSSEWVEVDAERRSTSDGAAGRHVFGARTAVLDPGNDHGYEYELRQQVGVRAVVAGGLSFSAPPADPAEPVRLAFCADTGVVGRADGLSDGVEAVLAELERLEPHVVLGGGDYAYRSSDGRWATPQQAVHAWFEQMAPLLARRPFMAQYGNHEVGLGERHRDWAVHLPAPDGAEGSDDSRRSYSFELGPCHVVAFYAPTGAIDPAELAWLAADLADSRERRDAWLIVFQHQPLVAHGTSHPADPRVPHALWSVLQRHQVDLHLSAHDQSYERTFPLVRHDGRLVAGSDDARCHRRGDGVVAAKVSPGGKRSDQGGAFSRLPDDRPGLVAAANDTAHHVALVEATPERLTLVTHAVRPDGGASQVLDRCEVRR